MATKQVQANIKKVETQMNIDMKLLIEWFQINLFVPEYSKDYIILGKKKY